MRNPENNASVMYKPLRFVTFVCTGLVTALLIACNGGGGDGGSNGGGGSTEPPPPPPPPPPSSAPDNPILYPANQDDVNRFELYLIDPEAPGDSARVNGTLVAGGGVGPYALSPGMMQVAYLATQDTAGVSELFLVDLAEPGTSTKLRAVPRGGRSAGRFAQTQFPAGCGR